MIQRKLIAVIGVVALLACSAGVGEASLARVEGMGLIPSAAPAPFLTQFTDDYVNIYAYPTSVVRQNNLVLGELGNNSDGEVNEVFFDSQSFTVIKNFSNFGAIAFQMEQSDLNSTLPGSSLNNQNIDLIWGRGFDRFDFAIRLDVTRSQFEFNDTADNSQDYKGLSFIFSDPYPFIGFFPDAIVGTGVEINTWGVTPAIALHLSNDNRVEAALTLRSYNLERMATAGGVDLETWEDDGNLSYALLVRGILNQGDRGTWYPAAWYVNDDLSYTVSNLGVGIEDREVDETYRNYGAGISHNMRVNDNNLLLLGLAVAQAKHDFERNDNNDGALNDDTQDFEEKTTLLPLFFAGLETDATSWLKIRLGATNAITKNQTDESEFDGDASETEFNFSDFEFAVGAGIRWNNLDIDFTINESFPLSGGWVLSGDEETPFTRTSATYHF